jgi:hypothetical protein
MIVKNRRDILRLRIGNHHQRDVECRNWACFASGMKSNAQTPADYLRRPRVSAAEVSPRSHAPVPEELLMCFGEGEGHGSGELASRSEPMLPRSFAPRCWRWRGPSETR